MKNSSIYFSSKTAFLKIIFFTFFILIISGTSKMFAQPEIEWERTYGGSESDVGISIQATPDGGFITASYSFSEDGDLNANNGSTDIWIAKTTATGDIEWQKNYGGSEGDSPHSIKLTPDGGYIMIGGTYSTDGDVSGNSNGKEDVWVIKLNAEGDLEWEQNYGGSESDWGVDIENVSIGGYMFIAQTLSSDGDLSNTTYRGERDTWVVYISETGQIISHQAHGGSETELPSKILALEDNSFMVVGSSSSIDGEVSSNLGFSDFWLMKVNLQADLIWEKSYGGSRTEFLEDGIVTQDGGFLLVGESFSSDGDVSNNVEGFDYWMIKLDENGEKEWTHSSGDTLQDYFTGVLQRPDGKYLVMKDGHGFSLYDEQGNEEWTYVFYNPTYQNFNFIDIVARPDGGFTTIGSAFSLISGAANKGETLIVNFKIPTLTTTPCAGDLAGFTTLGEFGGSKYYISNETARPSDAQDAALANGGHLATISSQEENDFIQPFLSEFTYIGLNDFDEEGNLVWSNGEALNYNNINPCDFCEENSEEQDFVIIQPWDGAWSFSNFYNQRKYLLEVPCDNNPISTPEDCSFSTQATTYVWQNLEECVVEQNGDFKWVINGGQNDVYSVYPPVGSARKREFKVTGNGEIEILPSTDYFGVPSGFIFLGFSKDLPLAYVFDNSGRLALCEYNFQERWRVDLPAGTNPDYLQVTELEDVVVVTGTTGVFSREVFFVKVISRNSGEVISETELPEQNLFRFGEAERNEAGDFYIFGTEYMFKLDAQLNLLWTSEFRNVVGYSHFSMGIAPDETAIYAGIKFSQEPVLIKTNSVDGTTAWEKNLDDLLPAGMTTSNNHLLSGVATLDGGVVVGYNTETSDDPSEGYVLEKFSMEGNLVWQRLLGPAYRNYKVQLATSGGGYVLTKKIFAPDFIDHIFLLVTSEGLFEPDCNGGTLADIEVGELLGVTSGEIYEGGDEIELTYNFENTGFANIDQEIDFRFYLTRIVQGDSIKTLLASSIVNGLLVDSLSEGFVTIQIPENVPTELYFIEIVADEENLIPEINELNNRATSSIFEIVNDSSTDCLTDLSGYTALGELNGSTYFLSENTAKPLDAQTEADDLGGYLVSINSQAENDFLANQISEMVYIGLNDYAVEEEIGWFNNDPLGFTNYDICDFCSANSEDLDFAIMHSWNGGWSWSSLWNSRKYIVELPCPTNLTNGSGNNFASILSENNTVSFSQSAALRLEEVFPNPAREYIVTKISAAEDTEVEIQVFDARGALVKNQKVNLVRGKNQVEINIHDLSSGVYSVFVRTAELGYTTLRFVK